MAAGKTLSGKTPEKKPTLKELGFYHSPAWRRVRRLALARDRWLCQDCLDKKRITPATEVHHVVPLEDAPELALELGNLRSLCWRCHEATKHRGGGCDVRARCAARVIRVSGDGDVGVPPYPRS